MMRYTGRILLLLLTALLLVTLPGCHKHVPGPEATCTEPQVCTECGKVVARALGHEPGPEATCAQPQTCTRCGEILTTVEHTPGAEATCTEPQTCTVCGAVVAEALGHEPGAEATCTEPQYCKRCGEQIAPARGHQVNASGACTVCGKQIAQPNQRYTAGGSGGAASQLPQALVPETRNSGHFHNNMNAYYSGAVLLCGDYGMEYFNPDPSGSSAYAGVVNAFAAKYPNLNVTSLIVPKCCAFESPAGYSDPYDNTVAYINNTYAMMDARVKKADAMGVMSRHKGEYMFYRTDHHWTSLGAYYASVAYCQANAITPYALDSYETVVKTGYIGSLYSFAGRPACLTANPDYTVGHYPHTGYLMSYMQGGAWYGGTAINASSNSYAGMFICGDQALTVFDTENKNGKCLIVFKESYGNAFVPYMLDYYERVVVVDIREATDSVATLISRYNVTDALIINNVQAVISHRATLQSKALS